MKKLVAFLFLGSLFLTTIGYHFLFDIRRHELKKDMKEYLAETSNKKDVIELRISLADNATLAKMEWENEKEFILEGDMYDVVEKKTENGELVISCVKDKKETHLVKDYTKLSKDTQGDPSSKNKSTVLLKLIAGIYIMDNPLILTIPDFQKEKWPGISHWKIPTCVKEILIPPPQAIA